MIFLNGKSMWSVKTVYAPEPFLSQSPWLGTKQIALLYQNKYRSDVAGLFWLNISLFVAVI